MIAYRCIAQCCLSFSWPLLLTFGAAAENVPALPAWPDQSPSIYTQSPASESEAATPPAALRAPAAQVAATPPDAEPLNRATPAAAAPRPVVIPAAAAEPVAADEPASAADSRHLGPRRQRTLPTTQNAPNVGGAALPSFSLPTETLVTTGTALVVVVGLFMIFVAVVRRGAKKSNARLPDEVVSVLGRVPLAPRQFAELVRVGNKLVLLSITPNGAEPLTEITDPAEIDRLVGLCRQNSKGSSTAEFDQIFRKLADEATPAGFLGNEAPRFESRLAPSADVFAAYRGTTKHA